MGSVGYDYLFKFMLIGDSGVGKSSILIQFSNGVFDSKGTSTIGIDFKISMVEIDGKRFKLQILDTAGQERFRAMTSVHYRNAMGVLLVYDITDRSSFEHIGEWIKNMEKNISDENMKRIPIILIGNKADLVDSRKVSYEEGKHQAELLNIEFYETSAKKHQEISQIFESLTRKTRIMYDKTQNEKKKDDHKTINIIAPPSKTSKCC